MAESLVDDSGREDARRRHSRTWWTRRNRLGVRNRDLVVILVVAIVAGLAVTLLTAYLGVR